MTLPRIFSASEIKSGQKIALDANASRHILQALRLKTNDQLIVFNDTLGEFEATILSVDKNKTVVSIGKFIPCDNESPVSIHLAQGISRGEKMDFTIQKAVELGVHAITPIFTEYCNIKLKDERLEKRLQHWQKIAISAAEQSGRCYVPKILPAENFISWCDNANAKSDLKLILDPNAPNKLSSIKSSPKNITILIGPDGGFSEKEISFAKKNDFIPINLGPRILRTETAALAAISVLQTWSGDFFELP